MILKDGRNWEPTLTDMNIWQKAYPTIPIENELLKMESWCYSNPGNRKTKAGIRKFVNSWLSRTKPYPISRSTRDTTLEQDLNDHSWA